MPPYPAKPQFFLFFLAAAAWSAPMLPLFTTPEGGVTMAQLVRTVWDMSDLHPDGAWGVAALIGESAPFVVGCAALALFGYTLMAVRAFTGRVGPLLCTLCSGFAFAVPGIVVARIAQIAHTLPMDGGWMGTTSLGQGTLPPMQSQPHIPGAVDLSAQDPLLALGPAIPVWLLAAAGAGIMAVALWTRARRR